MELYHTGCMKQTRRIVIDDEYLMHGDKNESKYKTDEKYLNLLKKGSRDIAAAMKDMGYDKVDVKMGAAPHYMWEVNGWISYIRALDKKDRSHAPMRLAFEAYFQPPENKLLSTKCSYHFNDHINDKSITGDFTESTISDIINNARKAYVTYLSRNQNPNKFRGPRDHVESFINNITPKLTLISDGLTRDGYYLKYTDDKFLPGKPLVYTINVNTENPKYISASINGSAKMAPQEIPKKIALLRAEHSKKYAMRSPQIKTI